MYGDGIHNVLIKRATLGTSDSPVFTAWLHLEGPGWGQGFGGYALDVWSEKDKERVPHVSCGIFLSGVMRAVNVQSWEDVPGKYIRVEKRDGLIVAIGHIVNDVWFWPKQELAPVQQKEDV